MTPTEKLMEKGCRKEICKEPDSIFCGDTDLYENPILCADCLEKKEQAEEIVKELRLLISAYDENNCDEALEAVKIYLKQLEESK